jgi:hypothetical protein
MLTQLWSWVLKSRKFGKKPKDSSLELMNEAWPLLEHKFSVRQSTIELAGDTGTNKPTVYLGHHRYLATLLKKHPVDLLAVESGYLKTPPTKYSRMA